MRPFLPFATLLGTAFLLGCQQQATEPEVSTSPLFSHGGEPTEFHAIFKFRAGEEPPSEFPFRFFRRIPENAGDLRPISCGNLQEPWLTVGEAERGNRRLLAAVEIGASEHISNGAAALAVGVGGCGAFQIYIVFVPPPDDLD